MGSGFRALSGVGMATRAWGAPRSEGAIGDGGRVVSSSRRARHGDGERDERGEE